MRYMYKYPVITSNSNSDKQKHKSTMRPRQGLYKTRDLDYTCMMVTDTSGLTTQLFTDPSQVNAKQYWASVTDESMPPVYR